VVTPFYSSLGGYLHGNNVPSPTEITTWGRDSIISVQHTCLMLPLDCWPNKIQNSISPGNPVFFFLSKSFFYLLFIVSIFSPFNDRVLSRSADFARGLMSCGNNECRAGCVQVAVSHCYTIQQHLYAALISIVHQIKSQMFLWDPSSLFQCNGWRP